MLQVRFGKIVFLVVALAAVGQFANTVYVPAISMIAHELNITAEHAQLLMTAYLLPYGCTQFIYGPLSDLYGRRPMVLIGLSIFLVGSLLTVLAHGFTLLLSGCLIQGTGAGVAGVMARTVMRDCYQGHQLYRANSVIAFALIFAPLFAPLIGGVLSVYFGWRSDFIFLFLLSSMVLVLEYYLFPETHLSATSTKGTNLNSILQRYLTVFRHPTFNGYLLCMALSYAGIAVFEAAASVLMTQILHFPPKMVSVLFIAPIPGYLLGAYFASYINLYLSLQQVLKLSLGIITVSVLTLAIPAFLHVLNVVVILVPISLYLFGTGLLFPTAMTAALDPLGEVAGTAGAILGGGQNLAAALMVALFTLIPQTTQRPLALMLSVCCALLLITYTFWLKPSFTDPDINE